MMAGLVPEKWENERRASENGLTETLNIAVAGKGGVGKTTVAALVIRALRNRKDGSVLAVDADPNSTLAEALGMEVEQTLGAIREEVLTLKNALPPGMGKQQWVELKSHQCLVEGTGFDLLVMGRTEGPGCYCYVNNLLRGFMSDLTPNYRYTVLDNEAGMEHLSRRTTRKVDLLMIVTDGSKGSLKAAERIAALVDELEVEVASLGLVLNRGSRPPDPSPADLAVLGSVPADPAVQEAEAQGRSLLDLSEDTAGPSAVKEIVDRALQARRDAEAT